MKGGRSPTARTNDLGGGSKGQESIGCALGVKSGAYERTLSWINTLESAPWLVECCVHATRSRIWYRPGGRLASTPRGEGLASHRVAETARRIVSSIDVVSFFEVA